MRGFLLDKKQDDSQLLYPRLVTSLCLFRYVVNGNQKTDAGLNSLYCLEADSEATAEPNLLACQCWKNNRQHNMVERQGGKEGSLGNKWSCWLFGGLESGRGKTGQFPMVVWSPARPQHTPSTESEESNPSVEVHGRKRRRGGTLGQIITICVCGHC